MKKYTLYIITAILFLSCQSKKTDSVQVSQKAKQTIAESKNLSKTDSIAKTPAPVKTDSLLPEIAGNYGPSSDEGETSNCGIAVKISKQNGKYTYVLKIAGKVFKGKVTVSQSEDDGKKETYVTFEGIQWAEYEGDVSNLEDGDERPKLKLPIGIDGLYAENEITIQNSGNAMNYYTKFEDCGEKYIHLVKK